jgi:hypothetical protein
MKMAKGMSLSWPTCLNRGASHEIVVAPLMGNWTELHIGILKGPDLSDIWAMGTCITYIFGHIHSSG